MFIGTYFTKRLFYLNIFIFILCLMTKYPEEIINLFAINPIGKGFFPTQLITHAFLHADISHIFNNMLCLLVFGPIMEQSIGSKKFLIYYMIMAISAAIIFMIFQTGTMIGASGAIFGVMTFAFLEQPNTKFAFGIKFKWIFYFLILLEIYHLFYPLKGVGHIAHIGGSITGTLLYIMNNKFNLTEWKRKYM